MGRRDPTVGSPARWWLNFQVSFGLAGGATWLAGTYLEQEFVAGIGAGLVLAALLLRMARAPAEGLDDS
ncbi:MAG: hypothetical protein OEU54_03250 [Gemmatimonadota bacterium]|nr:hypothetical protein [Gemmatimonadota bacterium]